MLTHNLTHTGKVAGGDSGADRTENFIFPEQKGPETAEHQRFPGLHLKVVGCRTHLPKADALRPDSKIYYKLKIRLLQEFLACGILKK